jgi:quercetin dioxygenase-like cupin family protein
MKRFILISVAALVTAGVAYAGGQPPITAQPLAVGHVTKPFSINVSKPGDVMFVQVKIEPGGSFGWHSHRAAVAVAVVAGTLTLYDSSDPKCAPQPKKAGQGFIEAANHVHLARNEGKTVARVMVAYLGAPHGKPADVPAKRPAQCASVT